MSGSILISYSFDGAASTRTGAHPLTGEPGAVVPGPGSTLLGSFPRAMACAGQTHLSTPLEADDVPVRSFTVRMLVQPAAGTGSELLCRCETVPFQLMLTPGSTPEQRGLLGTVDTAAHGGQGIQSLVAGTALQAGRWYVIDLVYAYDTLGVFLDGALLHPFGMADGRLRTATAGRLVVAGEAANAATRFRGSLAALQVLAGAPPGHEQALESSRGPWWHITRQYTVVNGRTLLGRSVSGLEWDAVAGASVVRFERGMVMYDPRLGAFSLDGTLYRSYKALPEAERRTLGPLTSGAATLPSHRWARFAGGGLFQSPHGTATVTGALFHHYLRKGGPRGGAGLPLRSAARVSFGREQVFQRARLYEQTATGQAFELRGRVLAKFLGSGGIGGCGFPQSDVRPVYRDGAQAGERADFQKCTIFQRDGQSFVVPLRFLRAHAKHGGLEGELGFPTSDVLRTGPAGTEYQSYERGTTVAVPGRADLLVCPAFEIFIKRLVTRESEGLFQGQNDPYFFLTIHRGQPGEEEEIVHQERFPAVGDYGSNIKELEVTLPHRFSTADAAVVYRLRADVWESDSFGGGDDDHLGDASYELSVANAWGMAVNNGVLAAEEGKATLEFAVRPQFNQDDYTFEQWHFFPFANKGTSLSWQSYATAFADDVDTNTSVDDVISDPFGTIWAALFYLLALKVTNTGNCWGFAVEAMQAWNGTSLFSPPLSRFTFDQAIREINVKHASQLGLDRLMWHANRFVTRSTQNPVKLFLESRAEAEQGAFPLLVIMKNLNPLDFWHAVLPYRWDDSKKPWVIETYDSIRPGRGNPILIDPDRNTWSMKTRDDLDGGDGTGSRLYHVPWRIAGTIPAELPRLDELLNVGRTVVGFALLWDVLETVGIASADGQNLDFTKAGPADRDRLAYMVAPVPLPAGDGPRPQLWMRRAHTGSVNYTHDLKLAAGVGAQKPWRYAVAFGNGELCFSGAGQAGDRLRLALERVGTAPSRCVVSGSRTGTFTAVYTARTAQDGSQVKMILEGLPLRQQNPVQLSWKPGVEGFEIVAPGGGEVKLTLTCTRNGTSVIRRYRLPLDGGSRVRISNAFESGELLLYRIGALNTRSTGSRVLMPTA
jgi:hypothetical protein